MKVAKGLFASGLILTVENEDWDRKIYDWGSIDVSGERRRRRRDSPGLLISHPRHFCPSNRQKHSNKEKNIYSNLATPAPLYLI